MSHPQVGWNEAFDRAADQLATRIAEGVLQQPVDQHELAIVVGQCHPVGEAVDELA